MDYLDCFNSNIAEPYIDVISSLLTRIEQLAYEESDNKSPASMGKIIHDKGFVPILLNMEKNFFCDIDNNIPSQAELHRIIGNMQFAVWHFLMQPNTQSEYKQYCELVRDSSEIHYRISARLGNNVALINLAFLLTHWCGPERGSRNEQKRIDEAIRLLEIGANKGDKACKSKLEKYKQGKFI